MKGVLLKCSGIDEIIFLTAGILLFFFCMFIPLTACCGQSYPVCSGTVSPESFRFYYPRFSVEVEILPDSDINISYDIHFYSRLVYRYGAKNLMTGNCYKVEKVSIQEAGMEYREVTKKPLEPGTFLTYSGEVFHHTEYMFRNELDPNEKKLRISYRLSGGIEHSQEGRDTFKFLVEQLQIPAVVEFELLVRFPVDMKKEDVSASLNLMDRKLAGDWVDARTLRFEARNIHHTDIYLVLSFPEGTVTRKKLPDKSVQSGQIVADAGESSGSRYDFMIFLIIFWVAAIEVLRRIVYCCPRVRRGVISGPPAPLDPASCEMLLTGRLTGRGLAALIVDLIARGYLRVVRKEAVPLSGGAGGEMLDRYELVAVMNISETGLTDIEKNILMALSLSQSGSTISLREIAGLLTPEVRDSLARIARENLAARRFIVEPKIFYVAGGIIAGLVTSGIMVPVIIFSATTKIGAGFFSEPAVLAGIFLMGACSIRLLLPLSPEGLREKKKWEIYFGNLASNPDAFYRDFDSLESDLACAVMRDRFGEWFQELNRMMRFRSGSMGEAFLMFAADENEEIRITTVINFIESLLAACSRSSFLVSR